MTRAELKSAAKEQIKGNIGMYFLCALIIVGMSLVLGLIPFVGPIAAFCVTAAMSLGYAKLSLGMTRGKKVTVTRLFEGFNQFGPAIVLNILIAVFTCLWALLLIIPAYVKAFSYSMSLFILSDNPDMKPSEAINESKRIMDGHKWELFVLVLSFIPWMLLGMITLGIAYIYVIPYMAATVANFYNYVNDAVVVDTYDTEEM